MERGKYGSRGELAFDEVESVLTPEALAVDDEEWRAEHALLDRVLRVGVAPGGRLRRRARLHHRVGIEAAAGDDFLQGRRIAGVLLLGPQRVEHGVGDLDGIGHAALLAERDDAARGGHYVGREE